MQNYSTMEVESKYDDYSTYLNDYLEMHHYSGLIVIVRAKIGLNLSQYWGNECMADVGIGKGIFSEIYGIYTLIRCLSCSW